MKAEISDIAKKLYHNHLTIETGTTLLLNSIRRLSKKISPIDMVTTANLDIALRIVGISLDLKTIDKIIDIVWLIESKGDDTSMKDIIELHRKWANGPDLIPGLLKCDKDGRPL
jgi:hypothetical protein